MATQRGDSITLLNDGFILTWQWTGGPVGCGWSQVTGDIRGLRFDQLKMTGRIFAEGHSVMIVHKHFLEYMEKVRSRELGGLTWDR